jgi:hypothetical protein
MKNLLLLISFLFLSQMDNEKKFPFGNQVLHVIQKDTSPKRLFILGVYASAVHAKWIDNNNKVLVKALAVASEPCIFWKGNRDEAESIINNINIPKEAGRLEPADSIFNGPSGRSLDENYLNPLGVTREEAWLCDLIPYSCINESQLNALKREYDPLMYKFKLPEYSQQKYEGKLVDKNRINKILEELSKSKADTIILLGDQPIKYFLNKVSTNNLKTLRDFKPYGKPHEVYIAGKKYSVIALAHPRQTSQLGRSNQEWYDKHQLWKIDMLNK